jgi:hypothetical protein
MEPKTPSIADPDVRRLAAVWTELQRVERALSSAGRHGRESNPRSLPALMARLGTVVRSHIEGLGLEPETDWSALARNIGEAEEAITRLVEELLWLLDCAGDVAGTLAGRMAGKDGG